MKSKGQMNVGHKAKSQHTEEQMLYLNGIVLYFSLQFVWTTLKLSI